MQFFMGETGRTVSFEDVLSGRGLERAYRFCTPSAPALSAADITAHAETNTEARQAIILFLNCLSNFVLTAVMMTGARQGVYLSGGIVPRLLPFFEASDFERPTGRIWHFYRLCFLGAYMAYYRTGTRPDRRRASALQSLYPASKAVSRT